MIELDKMGGRRIFLLLPFSHGRKMIRAITLSPVVWNHTLKWQNGEYEKSLDLLFEMSDQPEDVLKQIRYPDIDRILLQFMDLLPPQIRDDIAAGTIPKRISIDTPLVDDDEMMEALPEEEMLDPEAPLVVPPVVTTSVSASPQDGQPVHSDDDFSGDGLGFELEEETR